MKDALRLTTIAYFFGQGHIRARTHKINVTAFYLFQPNSALEFETIKEQIQNSSMKESEKIDLIFKFDELKASWKNIAVETIKSIYKTLDDSAPSSSDPANSLATQTTKLVIGGRTFSSNQSDSKPHGLEEEISR